MKSNISIAVVMPVFNAEKTLHEAIDSILKQTIDNYVLIAINDGSHDSSDRILAEYASHSDKIIILHQRNSGAGVSRNNGILKAIEIGVDYVAFLDSDDVYANTKLEHQLALMKQEPDLDMVIVKQSDIGSIASSDDEMYMRSDELHISDINDLLYMLCFRDFCFHPASVMIRTDLFSADYAYTKSRCGEDFQPFLYFAVTDAKVKMIEHALYYQRSQPGSLQRSPKATYYGYKDRVEAITKVIGDDALMTFLNDTALDMLLRGRDRCLSSMIYGARLDFDYIYALRVLANAYPKYRNKIIFIRETIKTILYPLVNAILKRN